MPPADLTIFGGGEITKWIPPVEGLKVAWGVGGPTDHLKDFSLIGSREKDSPLWVPCASCMSPLFDREYPITRESVTYLNTRKGPEGAFTNRLPFDEALAALGSAETVYTNSYHGLYWATLLGKEVIIDPKIGKPKFAKFHHKTLEECREANIKFDAKVRTLIHG